MRRPKTRGISTILRSLPKELSEVGETLPTQAFEQAESDALTNLTKKEIAEIYKRALAWTFQSKNPSRCSAVRTSKTHGGENMSEVQTVEQRLAAVEQKLEPFASQHEEFKAVHVSRRGVEGPRGETGAPGRNGIDGKMAYRIFRVRSCSLGNH